jgi:hypothetical protein
MTTCTGPSCTRPAVSRGLCGTHFQQQNRGQPLTPIRERGRPRVVLRVRVHRETVKALGPKPGERAREILEDWSG